MNFLGIKTMSLLFLAPYNFNTYIYIYILGPIYTNNFQLIMYTSAWLLDIMLLFVNRMFSGTKTLFFKCNIAFVKMLWTKILNSLLHLDWNIYWQCVFTTTLEWQKSTQCFFFFKPLSQIKPFRFLAVWRHTCPGCSHDCWWTLASVFGFSIDPPWVSCKQSTTVTVVGCDNEHSSCQLLPTSEQLKMQWITFVFEGNAHPQFTYMLLCSCESFVIQLHLHEKWILFVFFFMNLCQLPFLILC